MPLLLPTAPTAFGDSVRLPPEVSASGLVLLCWNTGGGFQPHRVYLPHQIYTKTFADLEGEITAHLVGPRVTIRD